MTGKQYQAQRRALHRQFAKAEHAFKKGDWQEARNLAKSVLAVDAQHLPAMEVVAKASWKLNDLEQLPELIRRMTYLNPYEPNYHALMAVAMQSQSRFQEASEALGRSEEEGGTLELRMGLDAWHAQSVMDLLRHDPVFACAYAKNPHSACQAKGILVGHEEEKFTLIDRSALRTELRADLLARPS